VEEVIGINREIVGLVSTIIGWAGFLTLVYMFRNAIVNAFSIALASVIKGAKEETQRMLIKFLIRRDITLRELYLELRAEEKAQKKGA